MTQGTQAKRWTKRLSFVAGLAFVVVLVAGWTSFPGGETHGVDLRIVVNRTGELDLTPSGEVIAEQGMFPGDAAEASLTVRNATGIRFDLRLRALAPSTELDRVLMVRIDASGEEIFNGYLEELRQWTRHGVALASGASTDLELHASLPNEAGEDFWPGSAKVMLELAPPDPKAAR